MAGTQHSAKIKEFCYVNFLPKEYLQDLLDGSSSELILTEDIGKLRWAIQARMIFRYEGKTYQALYSYGATECQDEQPFEYDADEIECNEVREVEKVVKVWERIKEN